MATIDTARLIRSDALCKGLLRAGLCRSHPSGIFVAREVYVSDFGYIGFCKTMYEVRIHGMKPEDVDEDDGDEDDPGARTDPHRYTCAFVNLPEFPALRGFCAAVGIARLMQTSGKPTIEIGILEFVPRDEAEAALRRRARAVAA